jgi:hypothetical protein
MGLQTPSVPTVLALTSPLWLPHSDQFLAVYISICIDQALAEPLRGQLYWAPVSKYFLASGIVFGVCRLDGSLDGGSICMSFPSVSTPLCPCISFWQEELWIHIFEVGGWPNPSTRDCAYSLDISSTGFGSPLLGILANVFPVRSWKHIGSLKSGTF